MKINKLKYYSVRVNRNKTIVFYDCASLPILKDGFFYFDCINPSLEIYINKDDIISIETKLVSEEL